MESRKNDSKSDGSAPAVVPPEKTPPPRRLQKQLRRKASGTTTAWLVVSESGKSQVEEIGKQSLMRRTGLRARELRILDPTLPHPSTLLARHRAVVVNLEDIKAIVTATEVLVLRSESPEITVFVDKLQHHLSSHYCMRTPGQEDDESKSRPSPMNEISGESSSMTPEIMKDRLSPDSPLDVPKGAAGTKVLPFEFRVLEVCLQCACKCLESEASQLEKDAYPALDELTTKISTLNLEHVRQIKSRIVRISLRVQKMRDELEQLLDDDMDMAEMYLTDKLEQQQLEETTSDSDLDDDALEVEYERDEDSKNVARSSSESIGECKPNVEELEMLLEAYFIQIDGAMTKLSTYVDSTEDYIDVTLDDKRNQLLEMGVMLSTAMAILTASVVVTGVLSMNIHIELFNNGKVPTWLEAGIGIASGAVIVYITAIWLFKKFGLLS
ncbi:hypothetical protein ACLOJK_033145 [Asimina triloba]